jgi:LPXTG-motif cell wall-anchored protein
MMSVTRLSFAGFMALALAVSASAIPLTLTGPIQGNTIDAQSTSDGPESFFLVPQTTPTVTETSTVQLMLAGAGLLGLGYLIRRRKSTTNKL